MNQAEMSKKIWEMSNECGHAFHSTEYGDRVGKLLFMTAAHESGGFLFRRQTTFSKNSLNGAFSLWQFEIGSVSDSIRWIGSRQHLHDKAIGFVGEKDFALLQRKRLMELLLYVQKPEGDRLACLLARLHYFRMRESVPEDLEGLSRYAKKYYNTHLGKATSGHYLAAYRRYAPHVQKD